MGSPSNPSVRCPTLSGHGLAHPKRPPSACGQVLLGSPQAPLSATGHSGQCARVALEQGHPSVRCPLAIVIII